MHTGRQFDETWFEQVFLALDRLHDAVCGNDATIDMPVMPEHMVGWLEDMIYTAQETIHEIRSNNPGRDMTAAGEVLSAIGAGFRLESEG